MAKATQTTKKTTTKITFKNPLSKLTSSNKSTGKKRCPTCGKYMGGAK